MGLFLQSENTLHGNKLTFKSPSRGGLVGLCCLCIQDPTHWLMSESSCLTTYLHNTLQSALWGHSRKGFYYSWLPRLKAKAENGDDFGFFFLSVSYENPTYFLKPLILICSLN